MSVVPGKKLLSASAIYTAGDFLTTAVSGFLLIPLYLRFMGPAEYGLYSTILVMITMLGVLTTAGLMSAVGRFYFIYRAEGREYHYLGSIWLFQTAVALAMVAALALWGEPLWAAISPEIPFRPYIWFVLGGAFLSFGASIYSLWLRVQERPVAFVVLQLAGTLSFLGLLLLFLVVLKWGVRGTLLALLGSSALMFVIAVVALAKKTVWTLHMSLVKPSLAFGGWMVAGTFGYFFLSKSQIFFLQHYSNLASVGVYNLGQQLGGVLMMVAVSFNKAWQPYVYSAPTRQAAAEAIARSSKFFVAVMVYMMLGLAILSNEILWVLAKPEYAGAGVVIRLVAIASFVYVLGTLTNTALLYEKRAGLVQLTTLVSAGVNVLLNILLIPRFQMVGAALSMLASFMVMVSIGFILSQRILKVSYHWPSLAKVAGLAGAMLALEWWFLPSSPGYLATTIRVLLLCGYPGLLLLASTFRATELAAFREAATESWLWKVVRGRSSAVRSEEQD